MTIRNKYPYIDEKNKIIYLSENFIVNQFVKIKWSKVARKRYEVKGYRFTKYGDSFWVDIRDLTHSSNVKVTAYCPVDMESREVVWGAVYTANHTICRYHFHVNDLKNKKFGRLKVIKLVGQDKHGNCKWECLCKCGNIVIVLASSLISGNTQSCGCYKNELTRARRGPKNGNWKPSLTEKDRQRNRRRNYPKYNDWRKDIYDRDNYTCQVCGDDQGGNLVAHHLYDYSTYKNLRYKSENGITLCENCHVDFHSWMGGNLVSCTKSDFNDWLDNL